MPHTPSSLLKRALGLNLGLSLICALAALAVGPAIAETVGVHPPWILTILGAGLLMFAAGIAWTLLRLRIGQALLVSALDLLWVVGTLPLLLVPGLLTPVGVALALGLAVAVGGLGLLQLLGIRRMLRDGAAPGQYRHCVRLESSADPEALWRVIRDLGAISRFSAGLSAARLEGEGEIGPGTVRICTNTQNQSMRPVWLGLTVILGSSSRV